MKAAKRSGRPRFQPNPRHILRAVTIQQDLDYYSHDLRKREDPGRNRIGESKTSDMTNLQYIQGPKTRSITELEATKQNSRTQYKIHLNKQLIDDYCNNFPIYL